VCVWYVGSIIMSDAVGGGHAPFLGLDDLLSQVQRVGVHDHILPRRPTTLQDALGGGQVAVLRIHAASASHVTTSTYSPCGASVSPK
jgi:hypothetical protein